MSESFDSYNAPQFFDFSKDLHKEDNTDAYFEVDHENGELTDPLKCRDDETSRDYNESYFNKNDDSDDPLKSDHSKQTQEECIELYSSVDLTADSTDDETKYREKLRRSMSVGNLYPLCNRDATPEYTNDLRDATANLHLPESKKYVSKNKSMNNLKKTGSNTSLNKDKTGPSRSSAPRLTRVVSRENINRLAQPKLHYGSAQSLNQAKYVSMAEAVKKFECGTPTRFRSKPKLDNSKGIYSKIGTTIPQSPALMTKQRHRPVTAISREDQERLEYEEAQKFKIKANPLNKRVLQGPLKPLVSVEKKPITVPEPFKIKTAPRKLPSPPKKEIVEFHAKPVPKSIYEPPKLKEAPKTTATKPVTPTFMKRYVKEGKEPIKGEHQEENKPFKPTRTTPMPFSFESRDLQLQKKKEEYLKKIFEEEKKAREFHARPVPKAVLNSAKISSLQRSDSFNTVRTNGFTKSDENISCQFKARPPTVLYKKPFEPKREERHLIEITEFQLNTEMRAKEREEFEQLKREKEERIALAKQLEEAERLQMEEDEVARIRKETEYKAQPIKKYKEIKIQPSGKVTEPVSPKFHTNKCRSNENKENSCEN